ncbi:MAG: hypothetical protein WD967_02495 [Candidatus Levyibacteriota bacterium]
MDNKNNSGGGGFIFGLIIGGALVFLLGTDKGRKILKSLTEESFGEISEMLEKAEGELIEEEPAPRRARVIESEEVIVPSGSGVKSNGHSAPAVSKKRFFRRSSKS